MKNIIPKQSIVKPLGEKTQNLADKWSPSVLKNGLGFGLAWLMKQLGFKVFEIANTNSMLPVFDYDHLLYCEEVKPDTDLKMYDVCVYQDEFEPERLIVHRIVSAEWNKYDRASERYKFKGDNNLFSDGWVKRSQVKWRVVVISYAR